MVFAALAGTAGDSANRAVAQQLLAPPDWARLAGPLIRMVQTIVDATATIIKGDINEYQLLRF